MQKRDAALIFINLSSLSLPDASNLETALELDLQYRIIIVFKYLPGWIQAIKLYSISNNSTNHGFNMTSMNTHSLLTISDGLTAEQEINI